MKLSSFYPSYRVQILFQFPREVPTKLMRCFGIHVDRYAEISSVVTQSIVRDLSKCVHTNFYLTAQYIVSKTLQIDIFSKHGIQMVFVLLFHRVLLGNAQKQKIMLLMAKA